MTGEGQLPRRPSCSASLRHINDVVYAMTVVGHANPVLS
ncbi:hypothetical protein SAMN04488004_1544 [Loktanella salsilacus]|uniref:Uncharacterized protein n=1 Tax=Loktanella salsilacus TaxID=195913 RepID=A0A1I4K1J7_9RHOB|nr:hypothetical protein SAMN04488004_1544 [Loktanella salsilacus]